MDQLFQLLLYVVFLFVKQLSKSHMHRIWYHTNKNLLKLVDHMMI